MPLLRHPAVSLVIRLERIVLWLFGPAAPWAHVMFGGLAAGWALAMVLNPSVFDGGMYGAISWLPDLAWIAGYGTLAMLHAFGLARPGWRLLRVVACLGSAWMWMTLALTFLIANGLTPGAIAYGQIGLLAVSFALYVAWRDRGP